LNKKDILTDENLVSIGAIKDIDTLSIINNANEIKQSKHNRLNTFLACIFSFIAILFNLTILVTFSFKVFLLIQLIFSWIVFISFIPLFKKKFV
jgi:hypothetical protein